MIKIFYSYSNHNECSVNTYLHVCQYFEKNNETIEIIDVDNTDNDNNILLLNKIQTHIDCSNIFICDVTPDYLINQTTNEIYNYSNSDNYNYNISLDEVEQYYNKLYSILNPNVSIELGYALSNNKENNIILIQNTLLYNKLPSLIQGMYLLKYNSSEKDYHNIIIEKINEYIKNLIINNNNKYYKFKYNLSEKSQYIINQLLDIQYFKNYDIIYNDKYKFLNIYKNNSKRQINITTKIFNLKNKDICLSYYPELYDELKHIELLINILLLK